MERTYDEEIHKRINHLFREMTSVWRNVQKMRSESNEYVWKTTGFLKYSCGIKMAMERYFEEHAQEIYERNWTNLEMQTTLLNTYPPKVIATILMALREKVTEK